MVAPPCSYFKTALSVNIFIAREVTLVVCDSAHTELNTLHQAGHAEIQCLMASCVVMFALWRVPALISYGLGRVEVMAGFGEIKD